MKVVFIHPDLGVGGAERLIVDAAIALKSNGHQVKILTNQYNPKHCFEDTNDLDIIVKANSLPRHLNGRFHAFLAYLKITLATLWLLFLSNINFDVVIVDQISLPIIPLRLLNFSRKFKIIFYCHYPDQLLCVYDKQRNYMKRLYRAPLDWLEMVSTGMADTTLVNSNFTKNVFKSTFQSLQDRNLDVLYPSLNTDNIDRLLKQKFNSDLMFKSVKYQRNEEEFNLFKNKKHIFLSINRYERKKNLKLAVDAMLKLKSMLPEDIWSQTHLVHAGGYDDRVQENVDYYKELRDYSNDHQISNNISLLRSISDSEKIELLKKCCCLIYSPTNEHFGIVPIEAMYCERPVIATNTGGPLETVVNDITGFLIEPNEEKFAEKMHKLVMDSFLSPRLGTAGKQRVINNFSFQSFKQKLNIIIEN
jgi:alpha-1,3/alpha-1,6-mannosyltransferase